MKKFSLLLMIVLIVGAVFISCSSDPARSSDVATVALSLDTAKALEADLDIQSLPGAGTLYWYYTAEKTDNGFKTGETTGVTAIRADNVQNGLPQVIGQTGIDTNNKPTSSTWFSTGSWRFNFYGVKAEETEDEFGDSEYDPSYADNRVIYKAENVTLNVVAATQGNNIGGTANIELTVANDTRTGAKFTMEEITVNLGHSYSAGTYTLQVFVDDAEQATIAKTITIDDPTANNGVLTFGSNTASEIIAYGKDSTGINTDHTLTFKVIKDGVGAPYATETITLNARNGYTWTISGSLANLDAVAWVGIDYTVLNISKEEDLRRLASYVNNGHTLEGKTVKLEHDIILTDSWTPIGNSYRGQENGAYFAGTFDGQGYTISGLTDGNTYVPANAKSNGEYSYGLFGIVKNATIKNINLTNVDIKSNNASYTADEVGAVVGYSLGSLKLDNITVSGSVVGDNVGGIIGRAYGTSAENETIVISNCTNQAAVSSSHIHDSGANSYTDRAAGIAGYINGLGTPVTVENCINSGNITVGSASGTGKKIIAGICCYGFNTGVADSYTFTNNKSTGALNVLGSSGTVHIASIVFMCNNPIEENIDTYSFTDASNYNVGTITVFGTTRTDVLKETH